jgi:DNA-binding Lrp family transcriptional regulator
MARRARISLDKVDCSIIRLLQTRGRESLLGIGKAINLSSQSVGDRVRRLEDGGLLKAITPKFPQNNWVTA